MFGKKDYEPSQIDLSKFIQQGKMEIARALVPDKDDKQDQIDFITVLSGRRPNLNRLFLAHVEEEGWKDLEQGIEPDLGKVNAVKFLSLYATSLDALRSKQLVELGKSENHEELQSAMEWLRSKIGRK
jgi:hypothetical protein